MATIDTSLFPSAKYTIDTGEDMPVTTRLNALRQSQMGDIQLQQAQQALANQNALRNAMQGVDFNTPEGQEAYGKALLGVGDVKGFQEFRSGLYSQAKAQHDAQTAAIQAQTAQIAQNKAHREEVDSLIKQVAGYDKPAQAHAALNKLLYGGKIDQDTHAKYSAILDTPDWKESILTDLSTVKDQLDAATGSEPKFGTYQPGDYTTASWAKFVKSKDPADLKFKLTATKIKASTATPTPIIPKLKQGERWNSDLERVEQVPGSAEYIKQSKLHGTDYGAVQAVNSKTELADKQIDRLLNPANTDAFNNLFGGYNAKFVTQHFTGATAGLKKDLDSLKQDLKSAGLELIKSGGGGAIGTITEREWPILEGMIESLDPTLPEQDARNKLAEIKAKMANLRAMAADKYETTWGETQYYKGAPTTPPPPADAGAGAGAGVNIPQAAIDHLKSNPTLRSQFDAKYGAGSAAKILGK